MDVDRLLNPVSEAEPCGPDLSYDPAKVELDKLAQGTQEQQIGEVHIAAEEPNWRDVRTQATDLFQRSKDLRTLLWLMLAELREGGLPGFSDGLRVMRGLMERYWDSFYPRLDPDDNNDPTERMNTLAAIAAPQDTFGDPYQFIRRLKDATLVAHPQLGRFSYRDVMMARGDMAPPNPETKAPDMNAIDGAFSQAPVEDVQRLSDSLKSAQSDVTALSSWLAEKVGFERMPQFDPLKGTLSEISGFVDTQLARKTGGPMPVAGAVEKSSSGSASGSVSRSGGAIGSSAEVLLALDDIIRYYESSEVSSPVPLVLKAAQRLVGKKFLDITRILTPEAIRLVEQMTGETNQESAPSS